MPSVIESWYSGSNVTLDTNWTSSQQQNGKFLGYYIAIGAILVCTWLFQSKKEPAVSVPFYKASKSKWMFDAETQIRNSYSKVSNWFADLKLDSIKTRHG
jgi:hypothetical protein